MTSPRLLTAVALTWAAAAALAAGGTFEPLFTENQTHQSSGSSSTEVVWSMELSAWDQNTTSHGQSATALLEEPASWYGLPLSVGAAVLFAGGFVGVGAVRTRSSTGWRWAAGIAGAGAAVLLGATGAVAMVVKSLDDWIEQLTAQASGRDSVFAFDGSVGSGLWMLLVASALAVLATAAGLIARPRFPVGPEPVEAAEPETPPFGVPVIRPVGYD